MKKTNKKYNDRASLGRPHGSISGSECRFGLGCMDD